MAVGATLDRHAAVRGVGVLLIEGVDEEPRVGAQAEAERGGNAPAVVVHVVAVGHLVVVLHQVDAYGAGVGQLLVDVGSEAPVAVGAYPGGDFVGVTQVRFFTHQVDAAAHRRNPGLNGTGALEHYGLLQVEGVGARGHAGVAHAVDGQDRKSTRLNSSH